MAHQSRELLPEEWAALLLQKIQPHPKQWRREGFVAPHRWKPRSRRRRCLVQQPRGGRGFFSDCAISSEQGLTGGRVLLHMLFAVTCRARAVRWHALGLATHQSRLHIEVVELVCLA